MQQSADLSAASARPGVNPNFSSFTTRGSTSSSDERKSSASASSTPPPSLPPASPISGPSTFSPLYATNDRASSANVNPTFVAPLSTAPRAARAISPQMQSSALRLNALPTAAATSGTSPPNSPPTTVRSTSRIADAAPADTRHQKALDWREFLKTEVAAPAVSASSSGSAGSAGSATASQRAVSPALPTSGSGTLSRSGRSARTDQAVTKTPSPPSPPTVRLSAHGHASVLLSLAIVALWRRIVSAPYGLRMRNLLSST